MRPGHESSVGPHSSGGIDRHLADLRKATERWLEHEYQDAETPDSKEDRLFRLSLANEPEEIEQPEPLTLYRRLKRQNLPLWDGGYWDQPYLFLMETDVVVDVEIEQERRLAINLKLQIEAAKHDQPTRPNPKVHSR